MPKNTVEKWQEMLGYQFSDPSLLELALTHSSVAATRQDSNERLEFLGDSVLGLCVCHDLYSEFGDLLEGEMTKIKSSVVSRQTCAEIAWDAGLVDMVNLGKGMSKTKELPMSVAAAVFESIIGAIFVDGGFDPARAFVLEHVRPRIVETMADLHHRNYKAILQQHAQHRWNSTPIYQMLDEKGPDHSKCFEIAVCMAGRHFRSGWGTNKKEAEQRAAQRALEELGVLDAEEQPEGPSWTE